jgi:hypothetical protein
MPTTFENRAELAVAILRLNQLAGHLADTRQRASAGIEIALREAYEDRASAETALRDAERDARQRALSRALGDPGAGKSVEQLQADLEAARRRFDGEIARLARVADGARRDRDMALGAVLSAAPGWRALMAALPRLRRQVQDLENLFAALGEMPGVTLPPHWSTPALRSRPSDWAPPADVLATWRDAIEKLRSDAATVLPGDVDD